jgi:hypothetical protein
VAAPVPPTRDAGPRVPVTPGRDAAVP